MRNFLKIADGIDVMPLLIAVQNQPMLWGGDNVRQDFDQSPHKYVSDILLRFSDTSDPNIGDCLICENTAAFSALPQIRPLVFGLMSMLQGEVLGRVMLTRLPPGKTISPHSDVLGRYANYFSRYHIPLQSLPGSVFRAGHEEVFMQAGSCWWFNAHAEHEVINNSADDRIHLIADIRTQKNITEANGKQ